MRIYEFTELSALMGLASGNALSCSFGHHAPGLLGIDTVIPSIESSSVCPECLSVGVNPPSANIRQAIGPEALFTGADLPGAIRIYASPCFSASCDDRVYLN